MDHEAARARINAIYPLIRQRAWYGKTYREFWDWYAGQCNVLRDGVRTDADQQWLDDEMFPLSFATDNEGFAFPEACYTSVIQPYEHWKSFAERWGMQEPVAEMLKEFRNESYPQFWKGKTYGEYWQWFGNKEVVIRLMARLPGERERIDAELLDIRQKNKAWDGMQDDQPPANVIA